MGLKVSFVKDNINGEVVAVFPEEKHSTFGSDVVMYVHHGQHTSGSVDWAREQGHPTYSETADLFNELIRLGYSNLILTEI